MHYQVVANRLTPVAELYPFVSSSSPEAANPIKTDTQCQTAIDLLKEARDAEAVGLEVLEKIVGKL